jgi:DNA-binding transcriptional MerR regulator
MGEFTIGEISARSGLTARALRILESRGILVPLRAPNGYRRYSPEQLRHAEAIRAMRAAGLSGGEIARIMEIKSRREPSADSLAELAAILGQVEDRLVERRRALGSAIKTVAEYRRELDARIDGRRRS